MSINLAQPTKSDAWKMFGGLAAADLVFLYVYGFAGKVWLKAPGAFDGRLAIIVLACTILAPLLTIVSLALCVWGKNALAAKASKWGVWLAIFGTIVVVAEVLLIYY